MSIKTRTGIGLLGIGVVLVAALVVGLWWRGTARAAQAPSAPQRGLTGASAQGEGPGVIRAEIAPDTGRIDGPYVGAGVAPASLDADLRALPQVGPADKDTIREIEFERLLPGLTTDGQGAAPAAPVADGAVQAEAGALAMPAAGANFSGLDFNNWGAGYPPDTVGDVGPNHYIQAVNTSIGIFNKSGTRLAAFTFNTFFANATAPCNSANQGDPVVVYAAAYDRWVIGDFSWTNFSSGPYYMCFAGSKTSDPVSGGWWLYTFRADDASHPWLNDYPKIGVWSDGLYMSANMFDILFGGLSASYKGTRVWALNLADMVAGATLRSVAFDTSSSYFSLLPSNYRGAAPPAGTPAFFLMDEPSSALRLWKFAVNWASPASSTFTGPTNLTAAAFADATANVPQLNGNGLDTLGDRLMMQLQYRNLGGVESLWVARTVAVNGVTGVRWYEIRNPNGAPAIHQQSTYQPDTLYRWLPSLAVDGAGNLAIGYNASSASQYPDIRYAGRLASDPLNTLGQGETLLISGGGAQNNQCGGAACERWGDYASMSVDPVDDCTFWFTTEYYETSGGNWNTRIGSFKFPSCTGGPVPTATPGPTATPLPPTPTPTATATPGALPPAAPSGLTAAAVSGSQINLAWTDNANNETGFKIERCTGNRCTNFAQIATVGANVTTFANTGLTPRTLYIYRVRATNGTGDSGYSNTASARTPR